VEVAGHRLKGLDVNDFEFEDRLFESPVSSRKLFLDFLKTHWDRVLHAAFVFQVQPLDPGFRPFVICVEPAVSGKARKEHMQILQELKLICGLERITIGGFATNGDSGYDPLYEAQDHWNVDCFEKDSMEMPHKQHYHAILDILHILKRVRYRMLKQPPMVVGLRQDSPELFLGSLIHLIRDDLPAVVFSDKPVSKMHDSLPMVLFRFEILVKLYEAREFTWVAHFFPWVLLNEAMSHKEVDTYDRVGWFHIVYIYLMKILATCDTEPTGHGVKPFGRKNAESTDHRLLFDRKSLAYTTNSIVGIVYEIKRAKESISLQSISKVPLERTLGATRLHARVDQT
jgi:hypothetical protein